MIATMGMCDFMGHRVRRFSRASFASETNAYACTNKEHIAVTEARRLGIKVVAIVDTNCDPDVVDYPIPGNDDAIRVAQLMCKVLSEAVKEGTFAYKRNNMGMVIPRRSACNKYIA